MMTPLQKARLAYMPCMPRALQDLAPVSLLPSRAPLPEIAALFPHISKAPLLKNTKRPLRVGVLFSGGPASGGHNVLAGLFDALQQIDSSSKLVGFLGGFSGLLENRVGELERSAIDAVRNQGGFDLIGTGRKKLETAAQCEEVLRTLEAQAMGALVVIGGDDSQTNAAVLAEYLLGKGSKIQVLGVPKTIDGDLRSEAIELSFGFDTACKTYAEMIGNIARDAVSSLKYYHFIKLMGRSASHVALECALLTQPNLVLIGEEKRSLSQVVGEIVDLINLRRSAGKEYGVILIPEGLIEFMPELQSELLLDRDAHGNVNVSQIATEELLIERVKQQLQKPLHAVAHFLGYEGRAGFPSNFDADYTYSLGRLAAAAIRDGVTAAVCAIRGLSKQPEHWKPVCAPLAPMLHMDKARGKPVIEKALVDLQGACFRRLCREKERWALNDCYLYPGPIQFAGDSTVINAVPLTLSLQH